MSESKINRNAQLCGYPSLEHYFIANAAKTFESMSQDLKVSITTVTSAYRELLERAKGVR
jgi:hypothetical protein